MQIRMLLAALVLVPLCPAQTKLEKELQTPYPRVLDQEREQFIEQFWRRRDPTPDTEENEYREEHYRRYLLKIQIANPAADGAIASVQPFIVE